MGFEACLGHQIPCPKEEKQWVSALRKRPPESGGGLGRDPLGSTHCCGAFPMRSLDCYPVMKRIITLIPRQHGWRGNTELSSFNGTFRRTGMAGSTPRRSREPQRRGSWGWGAPKTDGQGVNVRWGWSVSGIWKVLRDWWGGHSPVTGLCCAQLQAGIGERQSFTH